MAADNFDTATGGTENHDVIHSKDWVCEAWRDGGFTLFQASTLARIESALHGLATITLMLDADTYERQVDTASALQATDGLRKAALALAAFAHDKMYELRGDFTSTPINGFRLLSEAEVAARKERQHA